MKFIKVTDENKRVEIVNIQDISSIFKIDDKRTRLMFASNRECLRMNISLEDFEEKIREGFGLNSILEF